LVGWGCAVGDCSSVEPERLITKSVAQNANATVEATFNSRVFSLLFVPIPGTDYVNLYGRDITERVRAEEAVRESEERNRTTLQSLGDAVIATDGSGRIAQMNPVAETLTGWLEAEARGQPLASVFRIVNEETRAVVESPVARVLREGQVVGLANHTVLIAKDGTNAPSPIVARPSATPRVKPPVSCWFFVTRPRSVAPEMRCAGARQSSGPSSKGRPTSYA
jgi:PAS domain S-box-containing protein